MEKSLQETDTLPQSLIAVVAVSVGVLVANIYYAQPLISSIGGSIGVGTALSGSLVSVTQIGYGAGLFFLVSLADLVENRRLILIIVALLIGALLSVAISHSALLFFIAALLVGFGSSIAQILVPFVAHLAPPQRRGRVVGIVMGGLLSGIMLARPVALFVAGNFGWRAVFFAAAAIMLLVGMALARAVPRYQPRPGLHYGQVLASMVSILRERTPVRWRAAYQSLVFCAFNLFWTTVPLLLAQRFNLSQQQIALFALAGSGGALAAPIAGHIADRGYIGLATAVAMAALGLSFVGAIGVYGAIGLILLTVLALVIDAAVQMNQVVGQHVIFSVPAEIRGRVNAIYLTLVFVGGALGSVLGTVLYAHGGWTPAALCGAIIGLIAFSLQMIERFQTNKKGVATVRHAD
jgi:predicted MFS family arabinose efflux permease